MAKTIIASRQSTYNGSNTNVVLATTCNSYSGMFTVVDANITSAMQVDVSIAKNVYGSGLSYTEDMIPIISFNAISNSGYFDCYWLSDEQCGGNINLKYDYI